MHGSLTSVTVLVPTTNHINNKFSCFQVSGIQECVTVHTGKDFKLMLRLIIIVTSLVKVFAKCLLVELSCLLVHLNVM